MPTGGGGGSVFSAASPGAIGGTTSNTGQFTNVAIGASVPTLDGTTGDITISGALGTGGNSITGITAGDVLIARASAGFGQVILGGTAASPQSNINSNNSALNFVLSGTTCYNVANVYCRLRSGLVFANLPAATGVEGALASITDSTTATWGATITGGGANHVLAYSDGTHWTVAAI